MLKNYHTVENCLKKQKNHQHYRKREKKQQEERKKKGKLHRTAKALHRGRGL